MTTFEILDVWRPIPDELAYYRVLTCSHAIKYFVVDKPSPGPFPYRERQRLAFDTLPEGDWTVAHLGHLAHGEVHDEAHHEAKLGLLWVETRRLPDVVNSWHPVKIDLQRLGDTVPDPPMSDDLYHVGHPWAGTFYGPPEVGVPKVLALWEPWYHHRSSILAHENKYHALIQGRGIAQRFLGHLTENGSRVIGYMVESVDTRLASIKDLAACRAVLQKLHDLGIAHGRVMRENFLVLNDGTSLLRDFFKSYETRDQAILDDEMAMVEKALTLPLLDDANTPTIGEDLASQLDEMHRRDGGIHPVILWEAENEGRITVTAEEHKVLLDVLWHEGRQLWTDEHMKHALQCRQANNGHWFPMSQPDLHRS